MSRVCIHAYTDGAEALSRCLHCGTTRVGASRGLGCIWRDVPDARFGAVAPEPSLRVPACEDSATITARLAELARDRAALMAGEGTLL